MRANNQRVYTPKEGALVADINRVRRFLFFFDSLYFYKDILRIKKMNQIN